MPRKPCTFKERDMKRALKAAIESGCEVKSVSAGLPG